MKFLHFAFLRKILASLNIQKYVIAPLIFERSGDTFHANSVMVYYGKAGEQGGFSKL